MLSCEHEDSRGPLCPSTHHKLTNSAFSAIAGTTNNDCSVVFVNGPADTVDIVGTDVFVSFEHIGPVEYTECRMEQGSSLGSYFRCTANR